MAHSVVAGLGVLLGYRGPYGVCRAMGDEHLPKVVRRIVETVLRTLDRPRNMDPDAFARAAMKRLANPNIPDDPMRIALNGSTKVRPRFIETYLAGLSRGMAAEDLDIVLLPVAGFLRYTLGVDDKGERYDLVDDPLKEVLTVCGARAVLGAPGSSSAYAELISRADVMGEDLYSRADAGRRLQEMAGRMLCGRDAVRRTLREFLDAQRS
jgi:fructuronate reductase